MLRVLKVSSWTRKRRYLTKIKGRHMWSRVTQTLCSGYPGHDCGSRTFEVITSTLPLRTHNNSSSFSSFLISSNLLSRKSQKIPQSVEYDIKWWINTLNAYCWYIIVIVIASSLVDRVLEPGRVKPNTMHLVFVSSQLSTQQ